MKLHLEPGRPADYDSRIPQEREAYDFLDQLGIPYDRVDHEAVFTIDACAEVDRLLGTSLCKNLFLCNRQKTEYYLLMLPGSKKFVTKELSRQLGTARLSFADETALQELLGLTPGSVTVLGLMHDPSQRVQLLIDSELLHAPYICCHPCINTSSLRIATKDILDRFLPAVSHTPRFVELSNGETV